MKSGVHLNAFFSYTIINKLTDLYGKTVVITGASSEAGRIAALEFAKYGANLVLAARKGAELNQVKAD